MSAESHDQVGFLFPSSKLRVRQEVFMVMRDKLVWVGRVISGLLSLLLAVSAVMKLVGGADVMEGMAHLGLPASLIIPLGVLEISCVAIYMVPATSIVGAILLTGYIGGAILAHLRIGEPIFMQIALGVGIWLGLYLREHRLRQLIPLRKTSPVDYSRSTNM
jgi:hypothetical protein